MSVLSRLLARLALALALMVVVGWPAVATVREASTGLAAATRYHARDGRVARSGGFRGHCCETRAGWPGRRRLAIETVSLVAATVAIALPLGIVLALFLFRTDAWGRRLLLAVDRLVGLRAASAACDGLAGCAGQCRAAPRRSAFGRSWSASSGPPSCMRWRPCRGSS